MGDCRSSGSSSSSSSSSSGVCVCVVCTVAVLPRGRATAAVNACWKEEERCAVGQGISPVLQIPSGVADVLCMGFLCAAVAPSVGSEGTRAE